MGETIALRTSVQSRLKTVCEQVYYQRAKDNAQGPYIVFSLTPVTYNELYNQHELEIHIVGFGTDTTAIENLADEVWHLFNHYSVCGDIAYTTYPSTRNIIPEDNKSIIHRRITFTLKEFIGEY